MISRGRKRTPQVCVLVEHMQEHCVLICAEEGALPNATLKSDSRFPINVDFKIEVGEYPAGRVFFLSRCSKLLVHSATIEQSGTERFFFVRSERNLTMRSPSCPFNQTANPFISVSINFPFIHSLNLSTHSYVLLSFPASPRSRCSSILSFFRLFLFIGFSICFLFIRSFEERSNSLMHSSLVSSRFVSSCLVRRRAVSLFVFETEAPREKLVETFL